MKIVSYEFSDIIWFVVIHPSLCLEKCDSMTKRSNNDIKWGILAFYIN